MQNFSCRILDAADRHGTRPAIEMLGAGPPITTSYAQLAALSARWAAWLAGAGVGPGDRVALLAANDTRWVAAYLAVLRLGAVAVPLDTAYSADQVATILADAGVSVVLTSDRLERVATTAVERCPDEVQVVPLSTVPSSGEAPPADAAETPEVAAVPADAPAAILYTSGTTADPKGVVLTHANLEAERAAALAVIAVTPDDAVLGVLPLFHALAQMANLLLPLSAGARVVFLETIDSGTLLDALQRRPITVFACVPQFFYLIHQRVLDEVARRGPLATRAVRALIATNGWLRRRAGLNLGPLLFARVHRTLGPHLRWFITGGSRCDPAVARDLHGLGLTLLNGYGLTETSGAATVMRPDDGFTTSVGHPLPGVEVRVEPVPTADPGTGEILVRGPIVMREYYRRPDATATAIRGGWLHTGDLGFLDARGRVYITGRQKDVIVLASGKNLYPEEIEAHYVQSPCIRELCVLGRTRSDAPSAERLHAVVVPDHDVLRARGIVNVGDRIRFEVESLSVQLPAHKRVLSYEVAREALPRTTTGKLRRAVIAAHAGADTTTDAPTTPARPHDVTWLERPGRQRLVDLIARRTGRTSIAPDANLELDLGLDSMERVETLAAVEGLAGRRVAAEVRAGILTVRHLIEAAENAPRAETSTVGDERPAWDALLATPPDPDVTRDLARPAGGRALAFRGVLLVVAALTRLVVRWRIEGRDQLPARGPVLLCPNHQSFLDGFVLAATLPLPTLRRIFFVGAAEYFETPTSRRLARLANIVPVDPDANLVSAMRAAAAGLSLGKALILFPEGERSIDGTLKPFRRGAAILSRHTGAPIVPVALDGLYDLWPRGRPLAWRRLRPWRRPLISLDFGAPLASDHDDDATLTARVETAVNDLLHRRRRAGRATGRAETH